MLQALQQLKRVHFAPNVLFFSHDLINIPLICVLPALSVRFPDSVVRKGGLKLESRDGRLVCEANKDARGRMMTSGRRPECCQA